MLSNRLRQLRIEKKLLQKEVAEKIRITTSAYGFYEQGKRTPDANTLQELADFFDVSVDYLLGRSDIRTPITTAALSRTDGYDDSLPEEAKKEIDNFKEYIRQKYRNKKD